MKARELLNAQKEGSKAEDKLIAARMKYYQALKDQGKTDKEAYLSGAKATKKELKPYYPNW